MMNIIFYSLGLVIGVIGIWLALSVFNNLIAFYIVSFQVLIEVVNGKEDISTVVFYLKNSIGLFVIFIIGIVMIIVGLNIIKRRYFRNKREQ